MKPFVTVNIDGPPTIHQQATVADLLQAAKTLEQYALSLGIAPTPPPNKPHEAESWDDKEKLIT